MFFDQAKITPFNWIKKLKDEDRRWARVYLLKKGVSVSESDFEPGTNSLWVNDARHREIDQQIRNAWRQRKARNSRTGKKAYNFVLTNTSKRKLDKISESMCCSITEALVNIIEHEDKRIADHNSSLRYMKEEIEKAKKELEEKILSATTPLKQIINILHKELDYTLLTLAFKNLKLKNPATLHVPLEVLKGKVFDDYSAMKIKSTKKLGLLSTGLPKETYSIEELWVMLIESKNS